MQFYDRNDISMLKGLFWKLLSVRLTIMSVTRSAYPNTDKQSFSPLQEQKNDMHEIAWYLADI